MASHSRAAIFVYVALLAVAIRASAANSSVADLEELLDPARVAASLCGAAPSRGDSAFVPMRQMALAMVAESTSGGGRGPADVPLWAGLGSLSYKITATPRAQAYFDQGLRLAYAFNHGEAIRSFRAGQTIDPDCAMCFWGEALALGPNINAPMLPEAPALALAAVARAVELGKRATPKERALIAAMSQRYSPAVVSRQALDNAYADAMAALHARYPRDLEIAVLYADAAMNTTPWDYWEPDLQNGGRRPKGRMPGAVQALEDVLRAEPNHPGAMHFYIHLLEAVAPQKAEAVADRLAAQMPAAGHIVHMPSHIFFRLGRYQDALDTNLAAVRADEAFFAQAEPSTNYRFGYYPHNIHFALESAAMAGDAQSALALAKKLTASVPPEIIVERPFLQQLAVVSLFAQARFSSPETILELPQPSEDTPFQLALWHYARGIALALNGNASGTEAEAVAIAAIKETADLSPLTSVRRPAPSILAIADRVLRGRAAGVRGDWAAAVQEFEAAVELQDRLPYMEPAYWYYPIRQSLGVALLRARRSEEGAEVLRRALVETPNNAWVLFALRQSTELIGDTEASKVYDALFKKAWRGAGEPDLNRL